MKKAAFAIAMIVLRFSIWNPAPAAASPVLLSFDVEEEADVRALRKLEVPVPATYFVTGDFARHHPGVVRKLAEARNTIGSHSDTHPHFTKLDATSVEREVTVSKQELETITGRTVAWFRAPYLEYDERTMIALKAAGYQGDSSDKDSWARQAAIFELPISNFIDSSLLASDYDMIEQGRYSSHRFGQTLRRMYLEKADSGQPFVVLLHPRIVAKEADALKKFIIWAKRHDGRFMSIDGYARTAWERHPDRRAVWLDTAGTNAAPEQLATALKALGATDAFITATDARGHRHFGHGIEGDAFARTVGTLRSRGIRVHAVVSVLADRRAVVNHPEWAMVSKSGVASDGWLSPCRVEVREHLNGMLNDLLRYPLDGICLENLAYPDAEYDFSPEVITSFARDAKLPRDSDISKLIDANYTRWCTWRSERIADLAGSVGKLVRAATKRRLEISSIVPAASAIDFREPERTGQSVAKLASQVDLMVADLPLAGYAGAGDSIGRQLFAMRRQAGKRPVMVRLPDTDDLQGGAAWPISTAALPIRSGCDGVGLRFDGNADNQATIRQVFSVLGN